MVIIDTCIIIDHLRQSENKETTFENLVKKEGRTNLAISILTIQKLFEGKSVADTKIEEIILTTIAPLKVLPYSFEIAKKAGEIARQVKKPMESIDAAIAATAITHGAQLATLDKNDFANIPNLEVI
jgi:predicted nucleic acid-binding protein